MLARCTEADAVTVTVGFVAIRDARKQMLPRSVVGKGVRAPERIDDRLNTLGVIGELQKWPSGVRQLRELIT